MLIENRLSCEIPAELENLSGLTELWLRSNDLSGRIPPELARLSNLTQLRLSRNSLTGCIPSGLRGVGSNDLDSLGLSYCVLPSAPQTLSATVAHDSVSLTWDAPAGSTVTGYRLLGRRPDHGERDPLVHLADTGGTETSYTDADVSSGVRYVYRVEAINSVGAGPYSKPITATTLRRQ